MENQPNIEEIKALLKSNNLPYEDIISSKVDFTTTTIEGVIIGCIGVEKYGEDALLRSFVVTDTYKGKGIGKELLLQLIEKSKTEKVKNIHLLTTTAKTYFKKFGFLEKERVTAPEAIAKTKEFSEICPASSIYMIKEL